MQACICSCRRGEWGGRTGRPAAERKLTSATAPSQHRDHRACKGRWHFPLQVAHRLSEIAGRRWLTSSALVALTAAGEGRWIVELNLHPQIPEARQITHSSTLILDLMVLFHGVGTRRRPGIIVYIDNVFWARTRGTRLEFPPTYQQPKGWTDWIARSSNLLLAVGRAQSQNAMQLTNQGKPTARAPVSPPTCSVLFHWASRARRRRTSRRYARPYLVGITPGQASLRYACVPVAIEAISINTADIYPTRQRDRPAEHSPFSLPTGTGL